MSSPSSQPLAPILSAALDGRAYHDGYCPGRVARSGPVVVVPRLHFEVYRFGDAVPPGAVNYDDSNLFRFAGAGRVTRLGSTGKYLRNPVRLAAPMPVDRIASH